MSVWWAIGAALTTYTIVVAFVWSLCHTAAEADSEASDLDHTDIAPHPRIRLVPRPDADVISLEQHRRRHHPSTRQGPPAA